MLTGKYVSGIVAAVDGTGCKLTATFKTDGVSDKLSGGKIAFKYDPANGNWNCTSNLVESIRPKTCSLAANP
ncbi:Pilin (bacterial filament) [compost metagenome]